MYLFIDTRHQNFYGLRLNKVDSAHKLALYSTQKYVNSIINIYDIRQNVWSFYLTNCHRSTHIFPVLSIIYVAQAIMCMNNFSKRQADVFHAL